MKTENQKRMKTAIKIVLVISLLPWVFMLFVAVYSFFAGTTVGLFEAASQIYGIEAFLYTIEIYLFVFAPVYVITAIIAVVCTVLLIIQKKNAANTPKVIMTCGKICSGKSTYARKLRLEYNAVILSVDDITLALLGSEAGDKLDEYVEKLEAYFFEKSVEIIETGTSVILEWGFWQKSERDHARSFYKEHGIDCELHYLNISDDEWERRIKKRNADITEGRINAYPVDEELKAKFGKLFEPPEPNEYDIIINA